MSDYQAEARRAIAEYWRQFNAWRRAVLFHRISIVVLSGACLLGAGLAFKVALLSRTPWLTTFDLANAAVDLTLIIVNIGRWPKWPQPDPRLPRRWPTN